MNETMIPSTAPGMAWNLTVMRTQRGGIIASAVEVKPTPTGFEWELFGSRKVGQQLAAKRLTAKVRADGIKLLKAKLLKQGLTPAEVA